MQRLTRRGARAGALLAVALTTTVVATPASSAVHRADATSQDACASAPERGYGFDRYGGWKGLHRAPTGRFAVAQAHGRWSLFTPLGNAFYANGPTGIEPLGDYIGGTTVAPYHDAILAKYGSEQAWADHTFRRLCALGVRNIGGWVGPSDLDLFAGRLPYAVNVDVYAAMPAVPTEPGSNKPRRDVFAPDALDRARATVQGNPLTQRCASDPWCIGVYVENEQPYAPALFAGGSHLDVYLAQPAGAPGKRGLQRFFEHRYAGDLARFDAVWGADLASWDDFQALTTLGDCAPDPGWLDDICVIEEAAARRDDRVAFEAEVAGRNARLADRVLAELQPAMLDLGPRLVVSPYPPALLRAISAPADIVTVNNYDVATLANAIIDPTVRAEMDALGYLSFDPFERVREVATITHKPVWVSEWFYRQARVGVPSTPFFLPERPDAVSRAAAAGHYLEQLLAMPFVVGNSWFQWQDQPVEGRADGENQLIGIVDIHDDLVQPLASRFARINARIVALRFG